MRKNETVTTREDQEVEAVGGFTYQPGGEAMRLQVGEDGDGESR